MISLYASPTGNGNGLSVETPASLTSIKGLARTASYSDTVVVYLLHGIYELTDTLLFDQNDSGKNGYSVFWVNVDPSGSVLVSGAEKVTGWTLHDAAKNIWKAATPHLPHRIWVNGLKATRAKMSDALRASISMFYTTGDPQYQSSDPNMPVFTKPTELRAEVQGHPWAHSMINVQSTTRVGDVTKFIFDSNSIFVLDSYSANGLLLPYNLENAYEFLDSTTEGQWYKDQTNDTLYYVPRAGEDMATADVRVPKMEKLLSFDQVENVFFIGMDFSHTTWEPVHKHLVQLQSNLFMPDSWVGEFPSWDGGAGSIYMPPAAIDLNFSENVNFIGCTISKINSMGIAYRIGCKNSVFKNGAIFDASFNGAVVGNTHIDPVTAWEFENVHIINNDIHDVGLDYPAGVPVFVGEGRYAKVNRNHIYNQQYSGMQIGHGWANAPGENFGGHEVGWNHIHDVITNRTISDGGAIYLQAEHRFPVNTEVHDNYCHDIGHNANTNVSMLYPDNGTNGVEFYNNVMWQPTTVPAMSQVWLGSNTSDTPGAVLIGHDNYALAGMTKGGANITLIEPAIIIAGTDPQSWDAVPKAIALAAGTVLDSYSIPSVGSFNGTANIELRSTDLTATIYYTTDGSTPAEIADVPQGTTQVYSAPISVTETTTIRWFAKDTAGNSEAVQTAEYVISATVTPSPTGLTRGDKPVRLAGRRIVRN